MEMAFGCGNKMRCRFCGKETLFEICEDCIRKHNPNRAEKIWKKNKERATKLGEAYYDFLLKEYNKKTIEKDSKENFGFNTFCDGIRLGLDMIMPLFNESELRIAEKKIDDLLKIRKEAKNGAKTVHKKEE